MAIGIGLGWKATFDVLGDHIVFPRWFGPLFAIGFALLSTLVIWMWFGLWRTRESATRAWALWTAMGLSFVFGTAVHHYWPLLQPDRVLAHGNPVLSWLNILIPWIGLAGTLVLALLDARGRRLAAVRGLLLLSFLSVVPNDDCWNPFNAWWIESLGWSPLMYLPCLFAANLTALGLLGVRPRLNLAMVIAVDVAAALLGLSHTFRIVW